MQVPQIISAVLGTVLIGLRILSQTELWQRKEYRLDRMRSLLFSPEIATILSPAFIVATILLAAAWVTVWAGISALITPLSFLALCAYGVHDLYRIATRGVFRPHFTLKAKAIMALSALAMGILMTLWNTYDALQWATGIVLVLPIVVLVTALVNIPVAIRRKQIIQKARELRQQLSSLRVVGITGSYGKTSTKYFLQQLLSDMSDVVATAEHRNSDITVAQDMLQQLTPHTAVYIAEMGAYRRGEIAAVANLVQPAIGVITAIGNQHLALFGSEHALLAAKWELIESLPHIGTAVLNYDDVRLRERAKQLPERVIWYSAHADALRSAGTSALSPEVYVEHVQLAPLATSCVLHIGALAQQVALPLVSQALLSSAVAAAAAAHALNVPASDIFDHLAALQPFPRTMEVTHGLHGATIIDDSYSANEQGVQAALEHLARFTNSKRIVVFTPLIELGVAGRAVHERIGAVLARVEGTVFLTNNTYEASLRKGGLSERKNFAAKVVSNATELSRELAEVVTDSSVVLLEGRLPEVVRRGLL